jgi:tripartite-type tricarboxylate transporter receptor subunit TctC
MNMQPRKSDWCGAMVALALLGATQAHAQSPAPYPNKPIRVIVPSSAGGATDILARLFTTKLAQALNNPVIVENQAGNTGTLLGTTYVAFKAPKDGHVLIAGSASITTIPALTAKPPVEPLRDFEPIIIMSKAPYAVIVSTAFPATTMKEFIAYAKANPGKLNYAVSGLRSTIHLSIAWMVDTADINVTMIPYKGAAPAMTDLLSGRAHAVLGNVISAGQYIRAGKTRALAVTSAERSPALPDVPTLQEVGLKDYEVSTWNGWLGPKGVPPAVVNHLNAELNKILKTPEVADFLTKDGAMPAGGSPEAMRKLMATEIERWKRIVKVTGIELE